MILLSKLSYIVREEYILLQFACQLLLVVATGHSLVLKRSAENRKKQHIHEARFWNTNGAACRGMDTFGITLQLRVYVRASV